MLEQLSSCLNLGPDQLALESRRFEYMNKQELLELPAQGCSIELHGHIHNYPSGNTEAFKKDLQQCSDTIVSAGLTSPVHYCYPSGNFDAAASAVLSAMGVCSATTCLPGLIRTPTPVQNHYLPRFLDGESISMLEFQAEMSGFTELVRTLVRKRNPLQPA
jgi:peptidoglycan/xylan/chitin deacetylase (PgdA/CDA1 family)